LKAARRGDQTAQLNIAKHYYYAKGIKQDFANAFYWFSRAAEEDSSSAEYHLGMMYHKAQAVQQDYAMAEMWYTKAKEHGYQNADTGLFEIKRARSQEHQLKIGELINSAENGSDLAQFELGIRYKSGFGTEQDSQKSLEWFTKAAEQGNPGAQYFLGEIYDKGQGVEVDKRAAFYWYSQAAEMGNENAQQSLAIFYLDGTGGASKSLSEAFRWFDKAAHQGLGYSQFMLCWMYFYGQGVEKNNEKAYCWLLAATYPMPEFDSLRGQIESVLSEEQKTNVKRQAEVLKAEIEKTMLSQATEGIEF
jgi:TPR repeat protein